MKITKVNCYQVEIPYKSVYRTSSNATPKGRHVVVKIETDKGIFGWGETGIISRKYPIYGDNPESMFSVIENYLAPAIIGMNPTMIGIVMEKLEDTIRGNYFAKCAIDHAIYDITGKATNVSVACLLGGLHRNKFYVSRSLPLGAPHEVAERAMQLKDEGYKCLTLKGGLDYQNDIACFKATRKAVGENFPLEIDPNGGYDKNTAIKAILAMEQFNLAAVEQPIFAFDLIGMAEIKSQITSPLIADESVFTQQDLVNVIQAKAADVICLKPFKSGGLYFSKKMQAITEAFHLSVSTGSMHPFGIGTAALHQFIGTLKSVSTTGYGAPLERFVDDIVDENCFAFKDGEVALTEKPGLGIVINQDKLKQYTTKCTTIE